MSVGFGDSAGAPVEWEHLASPRSDLQSHCIKRTVFITGLQTTVFYLLLAERAALDSSASHLGTFKDLGMMG